MTTPQEPTQQATMQRGAANVPVVSGARGDAEGAREARAKKVARDHHLVGVSMYETACSCGGWPTTDGPSHHVEHVALAVMAVADEEQAALRAEVERLTESEAALTYHNRTLDARWKTFRDQKRAAEDRLREVEQGIRVAIADKGKLHSTWDKRSEMVVPVDDLRAVLAAPPAAPEAARCSDDALNCAACGTAEPAPVSSGEAAPNEVPSHVATPSRRSGLCGDCGRPLADSRFHAIPAPVVAPSAEGR